MKADQVVAISSRLGGDSASCPVCQHACKSEPLYRYSVNEAAAHFCPPDRDRDRNQRIRECIRRLWQSNDCEILRCDECGFAFGYPFVGGDEEFYAILHEQRAYPSWRWDYEVALDEAISKFRRGKVMDVGAGAGVFLSALGDDWEKYAVEGSETTRRDLESAGILVFREVEKAVLRHCKEFQVVTLFQVLEHIADFTTLIGQCRELLAPQGKIVITVPDGDAMIRQERVTGCADMPPNHINKWSPKSLLRVMEENGFECRPPVFEPSSWKNLKGNLHLRLAKDATESTSLAARAYRIQGRRGRVAALALLAGPALLRMLPHVDDLRLGGAFAIVGTAP